MSTRRLSAFGALLVISWAGKALAESETRLEAGIKYKPLPALTIAGGGQVRVGLSPGQLNSLLPEVGVKYRLFAPIAFATGYRFNYDRNGEGVFRVKQRVFADALGKLKWRAFTAKSRLRIQDQWRTTRKGETRHRPTLRTGLVIKWQATSSLAPKLGLEHFLALEKLAASQVRKWRTSVGAEWATGDLEFEVLYRLDLPVAEEIESVAHILVLGVALSL